MKTGIIRVDCLVSSSTIMAGATVFVEAPTIAAAPIIEYIPSSIKLKDKGILRLTRVKPISRPIYLRR